MVPKTSELKKSIKKVSKKLEVKKSQSLKLIGRSSKYIQKTP